MSDAFVVDLAVLDGVATRMQTVDAQVEGWLHQLDQRVAELHTLWAGSGAAAQRHAHQEWVHGAQQMRDALIELRGVITTAHANYGGAARTNQAMWS